MLFRMITIGALTVDSSLGRLDYDSLSDQARMEIIFAEAPGFPFRDVANNFLDVCDWPGVKCDAHENVTEVDLSTNRTRQLNGNLNLDFIPASVTVFKIDEYTKLCGTLNTGALPMSLRNFSIFKESFHGTVDMRALPSTLEVFDIRMNEFTGSCDLSCLPENLCTFNISANAFQGSIEANKLPQKLHTFRVTKNQLSGSIDLTTLPPFLERFDAASNELSGTLCFTKLPLPLKAIHVAKNRFSGSIIIDRLPPMFQSLDVSANALDGVFVLKDIPETIQRIFFERNQISGTAVLPRRLNGERMLLCSSYNCIKAVVDENGNEHRYARSIISSQWNT